MSKNRLIGAVVFLSLAIFGMAYSQQSWPQWRGPNQNGVSSASNLPTTWSPDENIVWKTSLPSWSAATPIIWGDRIFVASPSKAEPKVVDSEPEPERQGRRGRRRRRRDPGGDELFLVCLSRKEGKLLWERELDSGNEIHRKGNDASPSPVTNGQHVWVVTGTGVVTAFDMNGKQIWQKDLQKEYGPFGLNWGYASSPLLYDSKLIIEVLHGYRTDDPSYIVAFDAGDGKELWRQERPSDAVAESPDAYTTPLLLQHGGMTQIVVSGADYVTGHHPESGKELWRAGGLNPDKERNYRIVASPLVADGMLYAPTRKKPLLAFRLDGSGKVTENNIAWKWEGPAATDVPTPVCDGKYFYLVDDRGRVICLEAKSGDVVWGPERTAQGIVSASPLLADGKLYIVNEQAVTTVLAGGPEFKLLATNELDGSYTLASPAAVGEQLFVRTADSLYCIAQGSD